MKRKSTLNSIILTVHLLFTPIFLSAQENHDPYAWFNMGVGGSSFGLASELSMNYQKNQHLFTVRYVNNVENCVICTESPLLKTYDFGLLYGISSRNGGSADASISCGLSLVGYTERGNYLNSDGQLFGTSYYEEISGYTIGIPVESQLFLHGKSIGIGLVAFGNLNAHRSYAGLLLCLQIGGLK